MKIKKKFRDTVVGILRGRDFKKLKHKNLYQEQKFKKIRQDFIDSNHSKFRDAANANLVHSTWSEFSREIRDGFLKDPTINFFSIPVFVSSMTGLHIFHKNRVFVSKVEQVFGLELTKILLDEDLIGSPVLLRNCKYETSLNRLVHAYQLALAIEQANVDLKKPFVVTEWGGGFGGLARIFSRIYPNCTYNIVDIPEVSQVQYIYLSSILDDGRVILHDGTDEISSGRVNLIPNSFLEFYLPKLGCDIFISSWALSESNEESQRLVERSNYFESRTLLLIHQESSLVHPYADRVEDGIYKNYSTVKKSNFPYWKGQTIVLANKI